MKLSQRELAIIVEKCKKQDRLSQRKVYELFYSKMMGICLRYAKNEDEAKDILQDGFIKVFEKIDKYGFEGSFEGWLRRIIVNTAIDTYRRNKREYSLNEAMVKDENTSFDFDEPISFYESLSIKDVINAMQLLSPAYRTVFNLYIMEGMTHKEIANELSISEGTSKSNLAKAKLNIRKILNKKLKGIHE